MVFNPKKIQKSKALARHGVRQAYYGMFSKQKSQLAIGREIEYLYFGVISSNHHGGMNVHPVEC